MTEPHQMPAQTTTLSPAEAAMLRWELDQKNELEWPTLPTNPLIRWLLRVLGLTTYFTAVDLHITRIQRLLVLHQKLHLRDGAAISSLEASFNSMADVLAQELIPQVNRQTGAISSLLDRLQFYERHVSLLEYARKNYNKALAKKIAEAEAREKAERAAAEGISVESEPAPESPQLSLLEEPRRPDGVDTLTTDPQLTKEGEHGDG